MVDSKPPSVDNSSAPPPPPPSHTAEASKLTEMIQEAPDPDEDDLDDLDDLLDQFSANSVSGSGPGRPAATTSSSAPVISPSQSSAKDTKPLETNAPDSDFSAQLQKEMAALLGEIEESPEMRQQFDLLISELASNAEKTVAEEGETKTSGEVVGDDGVSHGVDGAFTDTIKRTMERMAASGEQASAAAASGAGGEDDMFANLLKNLASGDGNGSEEEFSKMLLGMMEQLTNKEVLYEPMKELDDKFPAWIKENEGKVPADDMTRYQEQKSLVREIVARFERTGYADENPGDREYIVERMQKVSSDLTSITNANKIQMQAAGNPPPDLVGNIKDTNDALEGIGNDCAQQ